jgi:O-antigen ligase
VSGLIVEAGIYLLLLFTPMAFGGVEAWAIGVFQILSSIVFVAWAMGEGSPFRAPGAPEPEQAAPATRHRTRVLWICIGLFVLLVVLQLTPLPPGAIEAISPATWRLYAETLPGYSEGRGFASEELPGWLLADQSVGIPEAGKALAGEGVPPLPLEEAPYAATLSAWRSLSLYPFLTRQSLTMLLCLAGIFAAVTGHFRTRERLSRLLAVSIGSVALVSFFGILQKLSWNGKLYWIREGDYGEVFGPFVNRNNFAGLAITVLPLALCLAFRSLGRLRRADREAMPLLILNSFAAVVIGGGIFFSLSRGGMLAAAGAVSIVGVLLFYFGRHTTELVFLTALFLIAGLFVVWIGSDRVVERIQTLSEGPGTPSLELRFTAWRGSLDLIGENWLVGTGFGTFRFAFMRYAPPGRNWWTTAHNEFIEVFTDTGLPGGLIALVGLGAFFRTVMRPGLFRRQSGRYAFVGMVAGIVALLVHSNVTSNLQIPANGLLLVVVGGALLCHVRIQERRVGSGAAGSIGLETPPGEPVVRSRRRKRA